MEWEPQNEQRLVAAAQQGNQAAFGELFDHYFPIVYRRVCTLIPASDTEDVTQEIFISIAQSIGKFKSESKFSTWVFTITQRRIADYYRKDTRQVEQAEILEDSQLVSQDKNPLKAIENEILIKQVLANLPEKQQEIVLLRLLDDYQFDEIAKVMGMKTGAVKVSFYRSVKACQEYAESIQI